MAAVTAPEPDGPRSDVFISYAHRDQSAVFPIAAALSDLGYDVWLDSTHLRAGENFVEAIGTALSRAGVYLVFLSRAALESSWVRQELSAALALELSKGSPKVLPVILGSVELPPLLAGRVYVDVSGPLAGVADRLDRELAATLGQEPDSTTPRPSKRPRFSSAQFTLHADTIHTYGSGEPDEPNTRDEATQNLSQLRRRANGLLLNFVNADEVVWDDPAFKFPNGEIAERVVEVGGPLTGTLALRSIVEVSVLNPAESKVETLVTSQLEDLGVLAISYQFTLGLPVPNLSSSALKKLQGRYSILGWDPRTGAEVALPDDVRLTVRTTPELIEVKVETRYPFQLGRRVREFSVREFVDWLLG